MTLEYLKERGKNDVRRAYDAGYALGTSQGGGGYDQGYTAGVEAGKKSQYDEFWDNYQVNGTRTHYGYAFAGDGWNDVTFKPKYPLTNMVHCSQMFQKSYITNLRKILEDLGIAFDTSNSMSFTQFCQSSTITHLPPINLSKATNASYAFGQSALVELELIVSETTPWSNVFSNCSALIKLIIRGTIGQSGFDVKDSKKLSKSSFVSIVNAFSTTESLSATFSKQAVDTAFETSVGAGDGSTSAEWLALLDTRPNCTISLI